MKLYGIFVFKTDEAMGIIGGRELLNRIEEDVSISYVSNSPDKNTSIGLCRENGEILLDAKYDSIDVSFGNGKTRLCCVKHIADRLPQPLFAATEFQKCFRLWEECHYTKFIEEENFIIDEAGEFINVFQSHHVYEERDFAPFLPDNETVENIIEAMDMVWWDRPNWKGICIEETDVSKEREVFNESIKAMFCQDILRISWICNRGRFFRLRRMYSFFWEMNAMADFYSQGLSSYRQFYHRTLSLLKDCEKDWEHPDFVQWKKRVIKQVFFLLSSNAKTSVILEEIRPCLKKQSFALLEGWYHDMESKIQESPDMEEIERIIGLEFRHFDKEWGCDSERTSLVKRALEIS